MTLRPDALAVILGMAAVTYLCRAGGYVVLRAARPPRLVEAMLRHLPGPLFVAYVAPAMAAQDLAAWMGAAAVVAVQAATRNLAASIAAGVATVALARGAF
ncbi:hypothetical protein GCM10010964_19350 [Caldovatus sediminis]|uniref:AzlD domain-containing protein n=1 Tax=Caldovatus sediminis TaxID=2041189 RepID=A0A8J2ZAV0_9PROT|nr:AzlD domain-containing protein [Caldovatus sediminis]GGG31531.1 hypothetical protein GCM10010964_19350 [Caldovatus sediminis]